jgi:Coenzyme PQQ synthesis protein D (PqqD)
MDSEPADILVRGSWARGKGQVNSGMEISFGMRASVPADVLVQELQGESVLLNLRSGRYFGLDPVGTSMWATLTKAQSLQAAYDALLAKYDTDGPRLERDLRALLERLVEHGLLEITGA